MVASIWNDPTLIRGLVIYPLVVGAVLGFLPTAASIAIGQLFPLAGIVIRLFALSAPFLLLLLPGEFRDALRSMISQFGMPAIIFGVYGPAVVIGFILGGAVKKRLGLGRP